MSATFSILITIININYKIILVKDIDWRRVDILERSLKEMKPGDKGIITRITGEGIVKRRLMDMGVTRGTEVLVRKMAPLGDPMEINLRGYELTLRKAEAENIIVEYGCC